MSTLATTQPPHSYTQRLHHPIVVLTSRESDIQLGTGLHEEPIGRVVAVVQWSPCRGFALHSTRSRKLLLALANKRLHQRALVCMHVLTHTPLHCFAVPCSSQIPSVGWSYGDWCNHFAGCHSCIPQVKGPRHIHP